MDNKINNLIKQYAIRLGDDSIVLGHRISEWCRNGPFLEEDLALQNVALDYIGRARMFYSYAAKLANDGSTEDTIHTLVIVVSFIITCFMNCLVETLHTLWHVS